MQRDPALISLSHQHQHALALCVRIARSLPPPGEQQGFCTAGLDNFQAEIDHLFESEIRYHFQAEEQVLFPAATAISALSTLVQELTQEHVRLRKFAAQAAARELNEAELLDFSGLLANHVRKEERQLFEAMQNALSQNALRDLGNQLDAWFASSGMPGAACGI
jgi:iron-sulfur cluster repair protein YtfE (RIC family)